jgi:hypothetical protein
MEKLQNNITDKTLEQKAHTQVAFFAGAQFEHTRILLADLIPKIKITDSIDEKKLILDMAKQAYDGAERAAKRYGAVAFLDPHFALYEKIKDLSGLYDSKNKR